MIYLIGNTFEESINPYNILIKSSLPLIKRQLNVKTSLFNWKSMGKTREEFQTIEHISIKLTNNEQQYINIL